MTPYYADDHVTLYHARWEDVPPDLLRADVLVTDPPYGIGVTRMTLGNGARRIDRGDDAWDDQPADTGALLSMGLPSVIWGGNHLGMLPASTRWLVWDKGTGDNDFADCELAWTNLPGVVKRYFRSWVGANARDGGRWHPTQKPEDVMRWCIGLTPPGTILDPYAGSGTTLVAAKSLGRKTIGVECVERYCEVAANRLRQEVLGLVA